MTRPASGTGEPPSVAEQLKEKSMVAPASVLARPATSVLFAPTPPMLYMSSRPSPENVPDRYAASDPPLGAPRMQVVSRG